MIVDGDLLVSVDGDLLVSVAVSIDDGCDVSLVTACVDSRCWL